LDEEAAQVQELKAAVQDAEESHRTEVSTLKKQYQSQISEITVEVRHRSQKKSKTF
jgi:hypothetical protein